MTNKLKLSKGNLFYKLGTEDTNGFVQYGTMKLLIKETQGCFQVLIEKNMCLRHLEINETIEVLYTADMNLKQLKAIGSMGDYDYKIEVKASRGKLNFDTLVQGVKQKFTRKYKGLLMENNTFFVFMPELIFRSEVSQIEVLLPNHGELLTTWFKANEDKEIINMLGEERVAKRVIIGATQYPELSQSLIYDEVNHYLLCSINGADIMKLAEVELGL